MRRAAASLALFAACSFAPGHEGEPGPGGVNDAAPKVDASPEIDAPPDAPDAPPVECPANYDEIVGQTSRFRLTEPGTYSIRHADCKDDLLGHTHLVVLGTLAQGIALRTRYNQDWWVGAVQSTGQQQPDAGWAQITGGAVPDEVWASAQPNDQNNSENGQENVAVRRNAGFEDVSETDSHAGLCECDHKPVNADVEAAIPN